MPLLIPLDFEVYRIALLAQDGTELRGDRQNGRFYIPRQRQAIIASVGDGWEHVSMFFAERTPSWAEMCELKRRFWKPDDVVVQYHPADKDYVNLHPHCLHLWRPVSYVMPTPPARLVA